MIIEIEETTIRDSNTVIVSKEGETLLDSTLDMPAEAGETRTIVGEIKFTPFLNERWGVDDDKPRIALARACYSRKRGQDKKNFSTAIARAEET